MKVFTPQATSPILTVQLESSNDHWPSWTSPPLSVFSTSNDTIHPNTPVSQSTPLWTPDQSAFKINTLFSPLNYEDHTETHSPQKTAPQLPTSEILHLSTALSQKFKNSTSSGKISKKAEKMLRSRMRRSAQKNNILINLVSEIVSHKNKQPKLVLKALKEAQNQTTIQNAINVLEIQLEQIKLNLLTTSERIDKLRSAIILKIKSSGPKFFKVKPEPSNRSHITLTRRFTALREAKGLMTQKAARTEIQTAYIGLLDDIITLSFDTKTLITTLFQIANMPSASQLANEILNQRDNTLTKLQELAQDQDTNLFKPEQSTWAKLRSNPQTAPVVDQILETALGLMEKRHVPRDQITPILNSVSSDHDLQRIQRELAIISPAVTKQRLFTRSFRIKLPSLSVTKAKALKIRLSNEFFGMSEEQIKLLSQSCEDSMTIGKSINQITETDEWTLKGMLALEQLLGSKELLIVLIEQKGRRNLFQQAYYGVQAGHISVNLPNHQFKRIKKIIRNSINYIKLTTDNLSKQNLWASMMKKTQQILVGAISEVALGAHLSFLWDAPLIWEPLYNHEAADEYHLNPEQDFFNSLTANPDFIDPLTKTLIECFRGVLKNNTPSFDHKMRQLKKYFDLLKAGHIHAVELSVIGQAPIGSVSRMFELAKSMGVDQYFRIRIYKRTTLNAILTIDASMLNKIKREGYGTIYQYPGLLPSQSWETIYQPRT